MEAAAASGGTPWRDAARQRLQGAIAATDAPPMGQRWLRLSASTATSQVPVNVKTLVGSSSFYMQARLLVAMRRAEGKDSRVFFTREPVSDQQHSEYQEQLVTQRKSLSAVLVDHRNPLLKSDVLIRSSYSAYRKTDMTKPMAFMAVYPHDGFSWVLLSTVIVECVASKLIPSPTSARRAAPPALAPASAPASAPAAARGQAPAPPASDDDDDDGSDSDDEPDHNQQRAQGPTYTYYGSIGSSSDDLSGDDDDEDDDDVQPPPRRLQLAPDSDDDDDDDAGPGVAAAAGPGPGPGPRSAAAAAAAAGPAAGPAAGQRQLQEEPDVHTISDDDDDDGDHAATGRRQERQQQLIIASKYGDCVWCHGDLDEELEEGAAASEFSQLEPCGRWAHSSCLLSCLQSANTNNDSLRCACRFSSSKVINNGDGHAFEFTYRMARMVSLEKAALVAKLMRKRRRPGDDERECPICGTACTVGFGAKSFYCLHNKGCVNPAFGYCAACSDPMHDATHACDTGKNGVKDVLKNSGIMPCPACGTGHMKDNACNHVTCSVCLPAGSVKYCAACGHQFHKYPGTETWNYYDDPHHRCVVVGNHGTNRARIQQAIDRVMR